MLRAVPGVSAEIEAFERGRAEAPLLLVVCRATRSSMPLNIPGTMYSGCISGYFSGMSIKRYYVRGVRRLPAKVKIQLFLKEGLREAFFLNRFSAFLHVRT